MPSGSPYELGTGVGDLVGYQVRFTRHASRATRLKVMTDGVLLAEISRDRDLRRYDTIILDEAHERSLNIDFLLGYLRQLTRRRRDLKVIVTSATIDTARFSAHFAGPDGTGAPIIEVSGRTYPVEVRYRPLLADGEADQVGGIVDAVAELSTLGPGDILVFLSGEREIRDTAEALRGHQLRATEVLPLYARLSAAEQQRVFTPHPGRRIVLATNVAETSLTVPGIRYVVDPGTARISRYSARTKVQRLPIEPISQASANQRAGRCGRVAPGVCIRLYSEEDLRGRPEYTEPEILRTNLASVILQMTAARLGEVADFPFVEAPDRSQIADGMRLLTELGALARRSDRETRLTAIGHRLAALPLDPRLARMLLEAERQGCLREMLVIVSGLSIADPRERPAEDPERAETMHRRFWSPAVSPEPVDGRDRRRSTEPVLSSSKDSGPDVSDFLAWVHLWDYLEQARKRLSGNGFRRMCRAEYLHFLRIREWQDLHGQLKQIVRELGLNRNDTPADPARIHTAALAGLLSHVGLADLRDPRPGTLRRGRKPLQEYLGARGTRFVISPGSSLARTPPPLVMAAETRRDRPAVGAYGRPRSPPSRWRRWASTCSSGSTPSRTGRPGARRCWRTSRSACSACRSWRAAGSRTAGSTRPRHERSSSGPHWWRASGGPGTPSSGPTRSCAPRSRRWRSGPGGATCWWMTRRSWGSTRPGCPRGSRPPPTSTPGGSRPLGRLRTCSP